MAYSGFSADDYLQQEYNSDLDFGTGDFYVMGWFKGALQNDSLIRFDDPARTGAFWLLSTMPALDGYRFVTAGVGRTTYGTDGTIAPSSDKFDFIVITVVSGNVSIHVNNVLDTVGTPGDDFTNSSGVLRVGVDMDGTDIFDGSAALIRVGGGSPSVEQIQTIYQQEKQMFEPGAKCTLQGTSSDVKAVDYDESTNVLTACSADHITKFNDLVVVEDWAEVATSVSTINNKTITGV